MPSPNFSKKGQEPPSIPPHRHIHLGTGSKRGLRLAAGRSPSFSLYAWTGTIARARQDRTPLPFAPAPLCSLPLRLQDQRYEVTPLPPPPGWWPVGRAGEKCAHRRVCRVRGSIGVPCGGIFSHSLRRSFLLLDGAGSDLSGMTSPSGYSCAPDVSRGPKGD